MWPLCLGMPIHESELVVGASVPVISSRAPPPLIDFQEAFVLQSAIKRELKRTSYRKIAKKLHVEKKFDEHRNRIQKRSGLALSPKPARAKGKDWFDPYYCARNANGISKKIWRDLANGTYTPIMAKRFDIPKKDGGSRELTSFSIPDGVIANLIFRSIVKRNIRVFSESTFAYLPDRDIFDAIKSLAEERDEAKVFAVQIDFKKFFDRIPHDYLENLISGVDREVSTLKLTTLEKSVVRAFMRHDSEKHHRKRRRTGVEKIGPRTIGTPQGSSVSLVLANLALHDLDVKLGIMSGKFVRYADDVVALTSTYEQALSVEDAFHSHAIRNKLEINREKSPGIAAFSDKEQEIRTISEIDFLGYRFLRSGTTISQQVEHKLKVKMSRLVNLYLHHYIKTSFNYYRCSDGPTPYDWDLLGLISELRRSIYGGNSERAIRDCLYRQARIKKMHGIMPHYALISDPEPFRRLDGWMVNTIRRAMRFRSQRIKGPLSTHLGSVCPLPSNRQMIDGSWLDMDAWRRDHEDDPLPEVRMPSFVRGWKAANIEARNHGIPRSEKGLNASSEDLSDLFEYI